MGARAIDRIRRFIASESVLAIAAVVAIASMAGNPLTPATAPIYAGFMMYGEELHPGEHPPLIEESTYRAAQAILAGTSRVVRWTGTNPDYVLRSVVRCGIESIQGYLFARPLPAAQIPHWLQHACPERLQAMRAILDSEG